LNDDDITIWNCPIPKCKGKLIYRINNTTHEKFLGCTNYPKCTYTQKCEDECEDIQDTCSRWE